MEDFDELEDLYAFCLKTLKVCHAWFPVAAGANKDMKLCKC